MPFLGSHTLQDWIRFARTKRSVSGAEFLRFLSAKIDDENEIFSGETPSDHRTFLANLTFEHLCVWILSQVADGLIHAHERGILHRDLKPSNILVTDEGQPLILDFNLSEDANAGQAFVLIGGTLEYMAPEHLKAVVAEGRMDVRSDIYSLGVILFQLLTGELPFPVREGSIIENLNFLINDRSRSIPSCRVFHSKISHDMESIVQRCLAAEPTARYQSTREFKSDLDRHLHNLPLRYAKNRSLRERARKWSKRHSKLKMALCFSAALTVILVLFSLRGQKIAKQNAIDLFHQFEMQRHAAVGPLSLPKISDVETEAALVAARDALAYYGFQEPHRKLSVEFRRLDSERQMKVLRWSRELLFLMAQSELKNRYSVQDEILNDEDREYLQRSLYQNELANKLIQDERQSTAVQLQRAEILRRLKQGTNEQLEVPFEIPPNDPAPYLAAVWLSSKGRYHQARPILEELQAEQPSNYFVALLLGYCCYDQHEYFQAEAYFTSCIAFRPDFHVPYLWRGINRMKMLRYEEAESDFCSVIKLKPQHTSGLANRAICYKLLKRYREAANDLTRMIEVGRTDSMPYLLRADVWRLLDETEKAKQDLAEGLNRSPIDSDGWNQRAIAWLPGKPENALADLDEALRLQPHYQKVLRNKAHVLSHYLKRHDEAIEVLGQVLSNDPMDSTALFGRGLLYARQGRRDDAIQDGRNALKAAESKKREPSAQIHYHVAQIFSLTSQLVPADAQEAVDLLRIALKGDIRLSRYLATDGALQPIADREDFKRLVTTVSW